MGLKEGDKEKAEKHLLTALYLLAGSKLDSVEIITSKAYLNLESTQEFLEKSGDKYLAKGYTVQDIKLSSFLIDLKGEINNNDYRRV